METVKLKVIETSKGSPRVLAEARVTIAPVFDKERGGLALKTGITKEDWDKGYKEQFGEYDKFYADFRVVLTGTTRSFDTSDTYNKIIVALLKNHPWIAKPGDELTQNHLFTIYDEIEEARKENIEFEYEMKAMKYLSDMSAADRANFLRLFGVRNTDTSSGEIIFKRLRDIVKEKPKSFVEAFEDKNKEYKILINDLISSHIVKVSGGVHYFGKAEDGVPLGSSKEQVVEYLKNPKHNDMLLQMQRMLEEKKKTK